MNIIRIAIDGPAAAGKSTVAKKVAKALSIVYVDTGATYRALTLKALEQKIDITKENELVELIHTTTIQLQQEGERQIVLLDDMDVTEKIRSHDVSNAVSHVAQHSSVRIEMVNRQKRMANNISVVMDGRDIGTHVLPDAEVKIFLIASVDERAQRRYKENIKKGFTSNLAELKKEIDERDKMDMNRKSSPLIQAEDAISIDTTSLSIDEVVEKILHHVSNHQQNNE